MNIPKFRAWLKDVGLMKNVVSIHFEDKEVYFGEIDEIGDDPLFDLDDVILMQSTGLTDKSGNMIFDGDILKGSDYPFISDSLQNYVAVVEFDEEYAQFTSYPHRVSDRVSGAACCDHIFADANNLSFEVIGNIHANKELLDDN